MSTNVCKGVINCGKVHTSVSFVRNCLKNFCILSSQFLQLKAKCTSCKSFILKLLICFQCETSGSIINIGKYSSTLRLCSGDSKLAVTTFCYSYCYGTGCVWIVGYALSASAFGNCIGIGISNICKAVLNSSKGQ